MDLAAKYKSVTEKINNACLQSDRARGGVELVAVSKTQTAETISELLALGHRVFGENRIQESQSKWPSLKEQYPDTELRLIGPLQSNKAADAVTLFDVIETIDREKIAKAVASEISKQGRDVASYVQVNTGMEDQKAGIAPDKAVEFVHFCQNDLALPVIGLMCIPPFEENPGPHFALLRKLAREAGVTELSMGMSGDFETAIGFGATSVRVGSAIFGARVY
ncbi:MAG: YggS family pyridoxal phosphate-dependent enzyme [Pseudomonadota bacterium]